MTPKSWSSKWLVWSLQDKWQCGTVGEEKESLQTSQKGIDPIFNLAHLSAVNVVICYGSQLIILKSQNHIY